MMNWNRVYELPIVGGVEFFPYQLAFGLSLRYLSCLRSVMLRLYFGPFKLWLNIGKE